MAEAEDAVVGILAADAGVIALAGSNVFGVHWPQNPPSSSILVQLISEVSGSHLRGSSDLALCRIQIDVLVREASGVAAKTVANALVDAINAALLSKAPFEAGGSPPTLRIAVVGQLERRVLYESNELREVIVQQDYRVAVTPL